MFDLEEVRGGLCPRWRVGVPVQRPAAESDGRGRFAAESIGGEVIRQTHSCETDATPRVNSAKPGRSEHIVLHEPRLAGSLLFDDAQQLDCRDGIGMADQNHHIAPPPRGLLLLESRALLEFLALVPAYPLLRRAPKGDGHPVLVLPGLMASDFSTRALRRFLRERGYAAHGWNLGRNVGPTPESTAGMVARFADLRQRYGRKLSLIGWSLGGIYGRELARRFPDDVRQVITLASPFRDLEANNVPARFRQRRQPHPNEAALRQLVAMPLSVPMTAIYSRTDGITAWQKCIEEPGPMRENIEVESSHLGIGHNPVVLLTIADRLAQPEGKWKPFRPPAGWPWPLAPRVLAPRAGPAASN